MLSVQEPGDLVTLDRSQCGMRRDESLCVVICRGRDDFMSFVIGDCVGVSKVFTADMVKICDH